jgi:hypothetical protein
MRLTEARAAAMPGVADHSRDADAARAKLAAFLESAGRANEARRLRKEK